MIITGLLTLLIPHVYSALHSDNHGMENQIQQSQLNLANKGMTQPENVR
jgi:hypothetical protein